MYSYKFRPGYGSNKLLIEFAKGVEKDTFLTDLMIALNQIEMKIDSTEDVWMNDEVLFNVNSSEGKFILSKDIWGCAFIINSSPENMWKALTDFENLKSWNSSFQGLKGKFENNGTIEV